MRKWTILVIPLVCRSWSLCVLIGSTSVAVCAVQRRIANVTLPRLLAVGMPTCIVRRWAVRAPGVGGAAVGGCKSVARPRGVLGGHCAIRGVRSGLGVYSSGSGGGAEKIDHVVVQVDFKGRGEGPGSGGRFEGVSSAGVLGQTVVPKRVLEPVPEARARGERTALSSLTGARVWGRFCPLVGRTGRTEADIWNQTPGHLSMFQRARLAGGIAGLCIRLVLGGSHWFGWGPSVGLLSTRLVRAPLACAIIVVPTERTWVGGGGWWCRERVRSCTGGAFTGRRALVRESREQEGNAWCGRWKSALALGPCEVA